jgi:hypothetical protein
MLRPHSSLAIYIYILYFVLLLPPRGLIERIRNELSDLSRGLALSLQLVEHLSPGPHHELLVNHRSSVIFKRIDVDMY